MQQTPHKFHLGQEVKDQISGYSGLVTSVTDFFYGCRRYGVTTRDPGVEEEKIYRMFDEEQLELIGDGLYTPPKKKVTGGPRTIRLSPVFRAQAARR